MLTLLYIIVAAMGSGLFLAILNIMRLDRRVSELEGKSAGQAR